MAGQLGTAAWQNRNGELGKSAMASGKLVRAELSRLVDGRTVLESVPDRL